MKGSLDSFYFEYFTFGFYLPNGVGVEVIERNVTRCQRAGKSAEQSAARSSDQVIEGAGMRLLRVRGDAVVLGDLAVHPEEHRLLLARYLRPPDLPLYRLHLYSRDVGCLIHVYSLSAPLRLVPQYKGSCFAVPD